MFICMLVFASNQNQVHEHVLCKYLPSHIAMLRRRLVIPLISNNFPIKQQYMQTASCDRRQMYPQTRTKAWRHSLCDHSGLV